MGAPLFSAVQVRVDVDGVPQVDGLSVATTGDRVLILAAPRALFEAAAGLVRPRRGEVRVRGVDARTAARDAAVAGAPLDPPLPLSWNGREYVTWSARLAGHGRRESKERAADALSRMKLESIADLRLRKVPTHGRRASVVAAALATGAATIVLEDPLRGLPEETGRNFARVILSATAEVSTLVFAARMSLASPLAIDADEALVLDGGQVVAQGAPAEIAAREHSYAVVVHGRGASFARLAEVRGARVSGQGARWIVDLGASLRTGDLFDMALSSGTVVLELRPLSHAFA